MNSRRAKRIQRELKIMNEIISKYRMLPNAAKKYIAERLAVDAEETVNVTIPLINESF